MLVENLAICDLTEQGLRGDGIVGIDVAHKLGRWICGIVCHGGGGIQGDLWRRRPCFGSAVALGWGFFRWLSAAGDGRVAALGGVWCRGHCEG